MKKENPDLAFGEVGKRLGELWKEVTPSEKSKFEDMAKKDKVGNSRAVPLPRLSGHEMYPGLLSRADSNPVWISSLFSKGILLYGDPQQAGQCPVALSCL